jgi:hypothetical protein
VTATSSPPPAGTTRCGYGSQISRTRDSLITFPGPVNAVSPPHLEHLVAGTSRRSRVSGSRIGSSGIKRRSSPGRGRRRRRRPQAGRWRRLAGALDLVEPDSAAQREALMSRDGRSMTGLSHGMGGHFEARAMTPRPVEYVAVAERRRRR